MTLTLINADLSQAELRSMAHLSGDEWLKNALKEGAGDFFDQHFMPAAFPRVLDTYGTIDEYKEADPTAHKEDRTKCKAVVYGLSFDRGAKAIADSLKIPLGEAETIIGNFLATAHQFAQWRQDVREAAIDPSKRDLLINPFGRRFQSEVITGANYKKVQREALAFLPQSTASDICLATAIRINKPLQEIGYHIFNVVHDAIMAEGEEDGADMVGQYIKQELRATGEMVFGKNDPPFLSDYSVGPSWADLS